MILAVDPGSQKCGLAILDSSSKVLEKAICATANVAENVSALAIKYKVDAIVIGRGTNSKKIHDEVAKNNPHKKILFTKESHSTLEARKIYWHDNPPKGLLKLIPTSLLFPPVPIDDYAAVVLGERYLKG